MAKVSLGKAREYTSKWQAKQRLLSGKQLITCQVCGKELFMINIHHLKKHGLTIEKYKEMFPGATVQSLDSINERQVNKISNYYSQINIPDNLYSFITGSMLGDGGLELSGTTGLITARYGETAGNKEYIFWKESFLKQCFDTNITFGDYISSQTGKTYLRYRLRTNTHPTLGEIFNNWYPEGVKIVYRDDIEKHLDELALSVWFYDDGHIQRNKSKSHPSFEAYLYPLCFSNDDVKYLTDILFSRFGINCWPRKSGNGYLIYIPREGRDRLVEIISKYPAPGMEYKINDLPQPKHH